ncbi:hypothetical protein [Mesoterricola sediminis]|uniref:Uncharacterized protein n=1 Tax=Mesoterricola sediminis TaxID=2927980 RepID=A0AA48HHN9_9BACT|nr:hypothetical protein [Mesoterricola sediminis]BDU78408.1 hypothetical protein METESE_33660 [Mesoterricola sediminis]
MTWLTRHPAQASIRTVLLGSLLILGGWALAVTLGHLQLNWRAHRHAQDRVRASILAESILEMANNLAFERGRAAVLLRRTEIPAPEDLAFLDRRRARSESAWQALQGPLRQGAIPHAADVEARLQEVRALRVRVSEILVRVGQDPALADAWYLAATRAIQAIQKSLEALAQQFEPGDSTIPLALLASTALELRDTVGSESFMALQLISAGSATPAQRERVAEARGRGERLWDEVAQLAEIGHAPALQARVADLRAQWTQVARPLHDAGLADLAQGRAPMPIRRITAVSVPALDGLAALSAAAAQQVRMRAQATMAATQAHLVRHVLVLAGLLLVLAFSFRYVLVHMVQPLEAADQELRRMGALPQLTDGKGSEVERITASTQALGESLARRAEAEAAREATIAELQAALDQIRVLKDILPICARCKKIRNDAGYWEQVESYISTHTDTTFTHGCCPDCAEVLFPRPKREA